tara:strand:- start:692 stop:1411 length:720 start_codon:yes stop_codon:yes gene_type:complete
MKKSKIINLVLLTGRGGSSFKDKNIRKVNGKPLLYYPCEAANKSKIFSYKYCSSDSKKILIEAEKSGFIPIKRPKKLASSTAKHEDVIIHALEYLSLKGIVPDIITVLMSNCATISSHQIKLANKKMIKDNKITAVTPIIKNQDHHPFRARKIIDGKVISYFPKKNNISSNRDELTENFYFTHSFWMLRLKNGKLQKSPKASPWEFMGKNISPIIVDYSIDIHDIYDLEITKRYIKNKK